MEEIIEEAGEITEEMGEEVGEEATEEAAEEEVAGEVAEARANVGRLRGCIDTLKEVNWGQVVKSFVKFAAKNVAAGAILWGVTVALSKTIKKASGPDKEGIQKKKKKITALAQLTSDISSCFKKLADWFEEKKDVTIEVRQLGPDVVVPLPDVFTKYTKPMEKHVDIIFDIAKKLWTKDGSEKKVLVVPTTDQVNEIINNSPPILNGLQDMITFANSEKKKFPELGTFPMKQYDVDKLNEDLEKIKQLPYA